MDNLEQFRLNIKEQIESVKNKEYTDDENYRKSRIERLNFIIEQIDTYKLNDKMNKLKNK